MSFKEDENYAINSDNGSAFNDSMLEGSEVFNSPKFEDSHNFLEDLSDD
jgi:hypothetical protein